MDAVSMLFSAYLNVVANAVHTGATDVMGTEIQAVTLRYDGMDVPFQYQLWQVRQQSVCGNYKGDIGRYSSCTLKAKEMFSELCAQLPAKQSEDWRYTKTRNMYCNAAMTYQPTIAGVTAATPVSEEEERRSACNLATAAALGSSDRKLIAEREQACGRR